MYSPARDALPALVLGAAEENEGEETDAGEEDSCRAAVPRAESTRSVRFHHEGS